MITGNYWVHWNFYLKSRLHNENTISNSHTSEAALSDGQCSRKGASSSLENKINGKAVSVCVSASVQDGVGGRTEDAD